MHIINVNEYFKRFANDETGPNNKTNKNGDGANLTT